MELGEYIQNVKDKEISLLEERVLQARQRIMFLVNHTDVPKADIHLNSETFNWYNRMPAIFTEHDDIMTQSKREAEDSLKVLFIHYINQPTSSLIIIFYQFRRERFLVELEGYAKQMEEFEGFGDLQEVRRYLKKAQALTAKLEEAQAKVVNSKIIL